MVLTTGARKSLLTSVYRWQYAGDDAPRSTGVIEMGRIKKLPNGDLSAVFDIAKLSDDERKVLHFAIESFSHLVRRNSELCFSDFCTLIRSQYDANQIKVKLCLEILAKATIKNRYICNFKVANDANSGLITKTKVVTAEGWDNVPSILAGFYGTEIIDLSMEKSMSIAYKKGTVRFDAKNIEKKL